MRKNLTYDLLASDGSLSAIRVILRGDIFLIKRTNFYSLRISSGFAVCRDVVKLLFYSPLASNSSLFKC